ncbi:hypothetical protein MTP99_018589 [Tenebrio molitor]|nr:hypothetical protein MTP99_018589 [Tenebrio molitor]
MHGSWTARPLSEETILEILKSLSGHFDIIEGEELSTLNHRSAHFQDIPESFDARENWRCGSWWNINRVLQKCTNQTQAHASGRVINDRKCIESKGTTKVHISVEDLVTCCKTCTSTNVCQRMQAADISIHESSSCLPRRVYQQPIRKGLMMRIKHYGQLHYQVKQKDVRQIQIEIMRHGPTNARMDVMEDLPLYVEGVYRYSRGKSVNPHGVRILGWGCRERHFLLVACQQLGHRVWTEFITKNCERREPPQDRECDTGREGVSSLLLLYFVVLMVVVFT